MTKDRVLPAHPKRNTQQKTILYTLLIWPFLCSHRDQQLSPRNGIIIVIWCWYISHNRVSRKTEGGSLASDETGDLPTRIFKDACLRWLDEKEHKCSLDADKVKMAFLSGISPAVT